MPKVVQSNVWKLRRDQDFFEVPSIEVAHGKRGSNVGRKNQVKTRPFASELKPPFVLLSSAPGQALSEFLGDRNCATGLVRFRFAEVPANFLPAPDKGSLDRDA